MTGDPAGKTVTVVGGGVAGLAAGCALAEAGYRVQLLERRPYVGGRASSYEHPGTGEVIDNCQHILLGCCTNLIDLYKRIGSEGEIFWSSTIHFIEPGGRQSTLQPSSLPAPLHTSSSFLGAKCFTLSDKITIARGIEGFLRHTPPDSEENFAQWLARHRQTPRTIQRFWYPVLASALNEDPEYISVRYAAKVFREAFLYSAEAGKMGIPLVPLSELYGKAVPYIESRGGSVHLRASVEAVQQVNGRWILTAGEQQFESDAVVLALPFEALAKLMPALPCNEASRDLSENLEQFGHSPITSVHLWFDRQITDLTHAALLDTTIQWLYNKSKLQGQVTSDGGHAIELVISASKALVRMERQQIIDLALKELQEFFPVVREAKLIKAAVTKEVRATYSIRPMLDSIRPGSQSPWPGIYLAGDWIATGWPSTMESGVRSGYMAAEAVANAFGHAASFVVPDLPPSGLMRLFP
ncbi:hydroxysqualene dehydroxylase HpnE [Silvibacterium acidisoli]|uniref:hydroxysqualene dehydroxylase HpnE n=1 Tax=Acidobacteriaceae bacterium ZG23-2 TaxID=2883246 RepID=UPI00406C55CB